MGDEDVETADTGVGSRAHTRPATVTGAASATSIGFSTASDSCISAIHVAKPFASTTTAKSSCSGANAKSNVPSAPVRPSDPWM